MGMLRPYPPGGWPWRRRRPFDWNRHRRNRAIARALLWVRNFGLFALAAIAGTAGALIATGQGTELERILVASRDSVAALLRQEPSFIPGQRVAALSVTVIDGDTVRANGETYRLVGYDTPETDRQARCASERARGEAATRRLRELVANGDPELTRVACACRPGTEGTRACNFGRLCGTLLVDGHDVGAILISEGLARPYHCGATGCPRRQSWCG